MRYKSKSLNLALFEKSGVRKHQFYNGVLIVGSPTTNSGAGNYIDATAQTDDKKTLMPQYATDLAGATTNKLQMAGLGEISATDLSKERMFVEAPELSTGSTAVPATAGLWYEVLRGKVTYKGVEYSAGEMFVTDGSIRAVTGTGKFAITYAPDGCCQNRKEAFKMAHLQFGDEVTGYHGWDQSYIPRNQMTTQDIGQGVGYIR